METQCLELQFVVNIVSSYLILHVKVVIKEIMGCLFST